MSMTLRLRVKSTMSTYLVWEQSETKEDALEIEADDDGDAACEWCKQNEMGHNSVRHLVVSKDGVEKKVVVYAEMSIDYSAYDERPE